MSIYVDHKTNTLSTSDGSELKLADAASSPNGIVRQAQLEAAIEEAILVRQTTFSETFASTLNASAEVVPSGFPFIAFRLVVPSGATIAFESTFDGTNWSSCAMRSISTDITGHTTTATGDYHGSVAGAQTFRVRVSVAGTGSGSIVGTINTEVSTLEGIETTAADDFEQNLALGKIEGKQIVNKYGRNIDVDTGTVPEDLWGGGGVYTGWATAAEPLRVASSDTNDTAAGTGARTLTISGLDASYNQITETVTLNGTSNVVTQQSFLRAHSCRVASAGSGGANVGSITVGQNVTTTNVMINIQPAFNQSQCGCYTVPAGYTALIQQVSGTTNVGTAGATVQCTFYIRAFGEVFRYRRPFTICVNSPYIVDIYGGIVLTEKSDVIIRCFSASANNNDVAVGYDMILVQN